MVEIRRVSPEKLVADPLEILNTAPVWKVVLDRMTFWPMSVTEEESRENVMVDPETDPRNCPFRPRSVAVGLERDVPNNVSKLEAEEDALVGVDQDKLLDPSVPKYWPKDPGVAGKTYTLAPEGLKDPGAVRTIVPLDALIATPGTVSRWVVVE